MPACYLGSSKALRCSCRLSIFVAAIARTFSSGRSTVAKLRPEALEFFVLVRRHEIAGDLAMAGHRRGPLLGMR